ncbi:unnamed protein product, partial [Linum tenue]
PSILSHFSTPLLPLYTFPLLTTLSSNYHPPSLNLKSNHTKEELEA